MAKEKQYRSKLLTKNTARSKNHKKITLTLVDGMEKQINFINIDNKYVMWAASFMKHADKADIPTFKDKLQILWLLFKPTKMIHRKIKTLKR